MFSKFGAMLRWAGVRLLVAVVVWAVAYTSLNYVLTSRRDHALAWLAENQVPATLAQFRAAPVDPADDAGPLWRAAAGLAEAELEVQLGPVLAVAELKDGQWTVYDELPEGARPMTAQELDRLRKVLADNRELFDILHRAALRPQYASPVDYSQGMGTLVPHTMEAFKVARVLCLAANIAAYDGHIEQAVGYWTSLRELQRENIDEPLLICQLVASATESRLALSVQESLRCKEFREAAKPTQAPGALDGDLRQMAKVLAPIREYRQRVRRAVRGEAGFFPVFFSSLIDSERGGFFGGTSGGAAGVARLLWLADETAGLDLWRQVIETTNGDFSPNQILPLNNSRMPWYAPLSRIIVPAISPAMKSFAKAEAARRVTAWSVALERQRLATGAYPKRLADIRSEFTQGLGKPIDPFTGGELVYHPIRRDDRVPGYELYSLGPNMSDDGGVNDRERDKDDIKFWVDRDGPAGPGYLDSAPTTP
jgi:hypothetical protein